MISCGAAQTAFFIIRHMQTTLIANLSHPMPQPVQAHIAASFGARLRGLMFTAEIAPQAGLLFIGSHEDRLDAAIHMAFVNYDLGIIWLNRQKTVVDLCLARRWRPFYMPRQPALYILEIHPSRLNHFSAGDHLEFLPD